MANGKNFLGIPIEGEISMGRIRVTQRPLEELAPLMQAIISDPTVSAVRWTQYTPYFADGDECVFSVNGMFVLPEGVEDDTLSEDYAGYGEEESESWIGVSYSYGEQPWLGNVPQTYNSRLREYEYGDYTGPDKERYDRLKTLAKAVEGGAFDNVLLEAFGDHCTVTITKEKISVDSYEHD